MNKFLKSAVCCPALCYLLLAAPPSAHCQLLVQSSNTFGLYNFDGTVINSNFITSSALTDAQGIAVSKSNIFVVNYGFPGAVLKFGLDGTLLNPSLIQNLSYGEGIVLIETNIYVTGNGNVGQYSTDGATINATLITNSSADGIATDDTYIYLSSLDGDLVGKFKLDGTPINKSFISGVPNSSGIAIYGSNIYVASFGLGTIGKYDLSSGAAVKTNFISGLSGLNGIAFIGGRLYAECHTNVAVFNLDGTTNNFTLIALPRQSINNYGITAMPPLALQNAGIQSNAFGFTVNGFSNQVVVVEASTNISASNWTPLQTNTLSAGPNLIIDPEWTNFPSRFYRLQLR